MEPVTSRFAAARVMLSFNTLVDFDKDQRKKWHTLGSKLTTLGFKITLKVNSHQPVFKRWFPFRHDGLYPSHQIHFERWHFLFLNRPAFLGVPPWRAGNQLFLRCFFLDGEATLEDSGSDFHDLPAPELPKVVMFGCGMAGKWGWESEIAQENVHILYHSLIYFIYPRPSKGQIKLGRSTNSRPLPKDSRKLMVFIHISL